MKARIVSLGGVAGLLVAVAALTFANPFRWIGLGDRPWLSLFLTAAGFGILCVTCVLLMARRGRRILLPALALVGSLLAALVFCGIGAIFMYTGDLDHRVLATSGDGRFEIIRHNTTNVIDPVEAWYLQTTDGPFSRRAYLGCLNQDSSSESFRSARFGGDDTVVLEGTKTWKVRFDPETVRTFDKVELGACTRQLYTG